MWCVGCGEAVHARSQRGLNDWTNDARAPAKRRAGVSCDTRVTLRVTWAATNEPGREARRGQYFRAVALLRPSAGGWSFGLPSIFVSCNDL